MCYFAINLTSIKKTPAITKQENKGSRCMGNNGVVTRNVKEPFSLSLSFSACLVSFLSCARDRVVSRKKSIRLLYIVTRCVIAHARCRFENNGYNKCTVVLSARKETGRLGEEEGGVEREEAEVKSVKACAFQLISPFRF